MKLVLLSLFDKKIGAYMTPFFAQSVGAGVRSVGDLVNGGGQEPPARHPDDFQVWCVGVWYDHDAHVEDVHELVVECVALRAEVVK